MKKKEFLEIIRTNINNSSYHLTIVNSDAYPRFAYTIGLSKIIGFELIFAGGIYYLGKELEEIIDEIAKNLKSGIDRDRIFEIRQLGDFSLSKADGSWLRLMMLGYYDFYNTQELNAYQILPDQLHHTYDIPDMSIERDSTFQPVWRLLDEDWDLSIPIDSKAITNLLALQGAKITEVTRVSHDEWEMFAGQGPDVEKSDFRVVPLATLLSIDSSLTNILDLEVGQGLWRDIPELIWNNWD